MGPTIEEALDSLCEKYAHLMDEGFVTGWGIPGVIKDGVETDTLGVYVKDARSLVIVKTAIPDPYLGHPVTYKITDDFGFD